MRILSIAFAAISLLPACLAQSLPDQQNFTNSNYEGFQIYGVSAFYSYTSYEFPGRNSLLPLPANTRMNYGTSGTVGWQRLHGKANFSARYTGGYRGDAQNAGLNSFNHSITLGFTRPLWKKWTVNLSLVGQELDRSQYLFEQSSLGNLAQSQAGFSDMAAALSLGQFSSAQSGLLLGGQSGTTTTRAALLGNRVLMYNGQLSLGYQISTRLSLQIGGFALGGQNRRGDSITNAQTNYIVPRTMGGNAGVTFAYSLTPRTDFSVGIDEIYVNSQLQRSYGTTSTVSLGRKMGQHWFLTAYGGGTFTRQAQSVAGLGPSRQIIYGGSAGFQTKANTLLANYNRSGFDQANAIIGTNTLIGISWAWRLPLSTWRLNASFDRNETSSASLRSLSGWRASGTVSKSLGWNLSLSVNYVYLQSKGVYLGFTNLVDMDGVRVVLGWTPTRRRADTSAVGGNEDDK
jgi:hypothetical protein